jgi:hypothetical protein
LLRALTMCHEKINIVKDVVDSIPRTEGVLVYTHYLESAHILAARLKRGYKEEIPVYSSRVRHHHYNVPECSQTRNTQGTHVSSWLPLDRSTRVRTWSTYGTWCTLKKPT